MEPEGLSPSEEHPVHWHLVGPSHAGSQSEQKGMREIKTQTHVHLETFKTLQMLLTALVSARYCMSATHISHTVQSHCTVPVCWE